MKPAILLQHYFPYGGLQRDALRLAEAAHTCGDQPSMIVSTWDGEKPAAIPITELNSGGNANHAKAARFAKACGPLLGSGDYDTAISFSRVPGVPFHFCGDSCLLEKYSQSKPGAKRLLPRYRYLLENEKLIFGPDSNTHIFFLAEQEARVFQQHYHLMEERFTILPPWLKQRHVPASASAEMRNLIFGELNLSPDNRLLLFVGSNFKLKRVGNIIQALPMLHKSIHLAICGKDDAAPLEKLSRSLGVGNRVHIMGPRDDIQSWMMAADLLVHPSLSETAGMVLVEALACGLPVTCTRQCGYAHHVQDAGGALLSNDADPGEIARVTHTMLGNRDELSQKALEWASNPNLYSTADVILERMRGSVH